MNESSPSSIPWAVKRYSAGRDIGGSGQERRSRLGIVQSRCCDNGWIVLGGGRVGMLQLQSRTTLRMAYRLSDDTN